jgi:hypothetical protein
VAKTGGPFAVTYAARPSVDAQRVSLSVAAVAQPRDVPDQVPFGRYRGWMPRLSALTLFLIGGIIPAFPAPAARVHHVIAWRGAESLRGGPWAVVCPCGVTESVPRATADIGHWGQR